MNKFNIILKATIEIGGVWEAQTRDEAIATAQLELRSRGEIGSIEVERAVYEHDEREFEHELPR